MVATQRRRAAKNKIEDITGGLGVEFDTSSKFMNVEWIELPETQHLNRYRLEPGALERLKNSIAQRSCLEQILVRKIDEKRYELISGYRIYVAHQELRCNAVPVKILPVGEKEAREIRVYKNLLREDLNPLEEVDAILILLQNELQLNDRKETIAFIRKYRNIKGDDIIPAKEKESIKKGGELLKSLGFSSFDSFVTNRIGLLTRIFPEVQEEIRADKINYHQGLQVSRLKDEKIRKAFLDEVIKGKYNLKKTREGVDELLTEEEKPEVKEDKLVVQKIRDVVRKYQKLDGKKKKKIKNLLAKIEEVLSSSP